jgi:hypothetical protein
MMAKKFDPKAKAKRQKMIAIGGLVLLVAILAVTLPSTLKQLNPPRTDTAPSPTPASAPAAAAPAPGTLAPPTLAGSGTPAAPAAPVLGSGQVASTDAPVLSSTVKLVSFSLFVSKDPFRQQVSATGASPSGSTTPTTGTTPTTPAPPTPPPSPTPVPPSAPPTSAVISVNGVSGPVAVGKTFPANAPQPYFQLVSVTRNAAKIGIAGGSLSNGQDTVTIPVGKTITLMNTADGTKYTIKVVSVG